MGKRKLTIKEDREMFDLIPKIDRFFKRKKVPYSYRIIAVGYFIAWHTSLQPDSAGAFDLFTKTTKELMQHFASVDYNKQINEGIRIICPICSNPHRKPPSRPVICPVCGKLVKPNKD